MGKLAVAALCALALPAWAEGDAEILPTQPLTGTVQWVADGDTFTLATGQSVRLLDINAPEGPHDGAKAEPYADAARDELKQLVLGKPVTLVPGKKTYDKYGRLLAHVYVDNGRWVNAQLVQDGMAVVYTFADNRAKPDELLALEARARAERKGVWGTPRWAVRNAADCCAEGDLGYFQVVQGRVLSTGRDKDSLYLNFGPDYRTDFTVRIRYKDMVRFRERGIDKPDLLYAGKVLRVHGFVEPIYGTMVIATHPEQLEEIDAQGHAVPWGEKVEAKKKRKSKKDKDSD